MARGICVLTDLSNKYSVANVILDGYSGKQSSAALWFNIIVRWIEIPIKIRLQERAEMLACLHAHTSDALAPEAFVSKDTVAAAEAACMESVILVLDISSLGISKQARSHHW